MISKYLIVVWIPAYAGMTILLALAPIMRQLLLENDRQGNYSKVFVMLRL